MVTGSYDKTLCLWNSKDGVVLKKMKEHRAQVTAVAVSGNSRLIASGDWDGKLIAWDGDTGESLEIIEAHHKVITSLDFSPDSAVLVTVSHEGTIKSWRTDTWQIIGNPIYVGERIYCVRFSPSGKFLAIATIQHVQICNSSAGLECIAEITAFSYSLAWTPDGTRLLTGNFNHTIREWDTSTWKQVGDSWSGHTNTICDLAVNSTGTLLASASRDNHVRLWRISDQRTVAAFCHSHAVCSATFSVYRVTFSVNGEYILCGGADTNITEWRVPEDVLLEDKPNAQISSVSFSSFAIPLSI